jgi:hypothetical protein
LSEKQPRRSHRIHDLFTRSCCALDNGEVEVVFDCFTVDAILKTPVIDISGHHEIRACAGRFATKAAICARGIDGADMPGGASARLQALGLVHCRGLRIREKVDQHLCRDWLL